MICAWIVTFVFYLVVGCMVGMVFTVGDFSDKALAKGSAIAVVWPIAICVAVVWAVVVGTVMLWRSYAVWLGPVVRLVYAAGAHVVARRKRRRALPKAQVRR